MTLRGRIVIKLNYYEKMHTDMSEDLCDARATLS